MYCYEFSLGTKSFSRYGLDDRSSRKIFARYVRQAWNKGYKYANIFPGNTPIYHTAKIKRYRLLPGNIVSCANPVTLENFEANEISIAEFCRVWK